MGELVDLVCRPISYLIFIKLTMYPRKYLKNKDQFLHQWSAELRKY